MKPQNRILLLLLFLTFCHISLWAKTLTVALVQNEKAPAVALDMSRTIEDEILGVYFDAGHIVSNNDIQFDGSQFAKDNYGLHEAAVGYSDYLIVVYLEYGPAEKKDETTHASYAELLAAKWRVVKVSSTRILAEGAIDVTKIRVTDFDPYQRARLVADKITTATLSVIGE